MRCSIRASARRRQPHERARATCCARRKAWPGWSLLCLLALAALLAPVVFPGRSAGDRGAGAGAALHRRLRFPLGTDRLGRDVLAGLVHGARASLAVGIAAAAVAIVVGALVGTLAGFAGGLIDEALMRVVDAFQIVPGFLLALAFVSVIGAVAAGGRSSPSRSAPGPGRRGWRAPRCCRSASATMSPPRA